MTIIDISRTHQAAPLYAGTPAPVFEKTQTLEHDGCEVSTVHTDCHVGTHADAFSHFLGDAGASIDRMPLNLYCGKCLLLSVPAGTLITVEHLRGRLDGAHRLALRSGGSSYLSEAAAEYISACGIRAVVTDAVSVGPPDNEAAVHKALFRGGVAVIENADFGVVEDGEYLLFAFPVKYGDCDAAPVRAVFLRQD